MILRMAILMAKVCCLDRLDLHIVKDRVETDKRIAVNLSWSPSEDVEYYIVYRRRPDLSDEFQTISTFNFDDSERIRVLNAYPSEHSSCPAKPGSRDWYVCKANFIFANGTSASVSQSSSLKVWMEGGSLNGTRFENLGKSTISNEQLITVDIIEVEELKKRRSLIWNYDIVAFGSWDGNGGRDGSLSSSICNFPDEALTNEIQKYLDCKFSVIASHDIISRITGTIHAFGRIRERFGLRVGGRSDPNEVDVDASNVPMVQGWSQGTNVAVVAKKGQIVSYPWNISGHSFRVHWSHTYSNLVQHGDVWVTLNLSVPQEILAQDPAYIEGTFDIPFGYTAWEGSHLDSYLSTLNNTAVIQTGHYYCIATIDERKLWANLIYYMKQRTNKTKIVDRSIVDEEAPPIPHCECYGNDNWMFDIKCTAVDSNISFEYLVHGFSASNTLVAASSEVQFNATSEISHFIYLFDDSETVSDDYLATHGSVYEGNSFNKIFHPVTGKKSFMHIAVVDKSGNASPLSDYYLPSKCTHITQMFTNERISSIYTRKLMTCFIYPLLYTLTNQRYN